MDNKSNTPQGSILSPLFCNILLSEFDKQASLICTRANGDLTYKKAVNPIVSGSKVRGALGQILKGETATADIKYEASCGTFRRLNYVRYANAFLFGYTGPKLEAYSVLSEVSNTLSLITNLDLSIDKTNVTYHKRGVLFLGYIIKGNIIQGTRIKGTVAPKYKFNLSFIVPLEQLLEKYTEKGFLQRSAKTSSNRFVGRRQDK